MDEVVLRHGIVTPLSVSRFVEAAMVRRDKTDGTEATRSVGVAARTFDNLATPVHVTPGSLLDTAHRLNRRGDAAGARLLLHAARRLHPPCPKLEAALDELTPHNAMRRHRQRAVATALAVIAATAGVALLIPVGLFALAPLVALRWFWLRRVDLPGLSRADSAAHRAFRRLRHNGASGQVEPSRRNSRSTYTTSGVVGLLLGAGLAGVLTNALLGRWPGAVVAVIATLAVVVPTLVGALGTRQVHRRLLARARDRRKAVEKRRRLAVADRCQCWQARLLVGLDAEAYQERHLQDEPTLAVPTAVQEQLGGVSRLARCSGTGALWLGGAGGPGGPTLLLRGALVAPAAPTWDAGGYL